MFIGNMFKGLLKSALLLVVVFAISGCSSIFGDEFGDEFSRAVGWEKPDIDDQDIKASPPLTVPPDYDLVAPPDGGEPLASRLQAQESRQELQTPSQPSGQPSAVTRLPKAEPQLMPRKTVRVGDHSAQRAADGQGGQFDGYANIPDGVRAQFDRSLDKYAGANRNGLPPSEAKPLVPMRPTVVPQTSARRYGSRIETRPDGQAGTQTEPQPMAREPGSKAIASEEHKPEPKAYKGNVCDKVTVSNGGYRCLD